MYERVKQEQQLCLEHKKQTEFICYDCNKLLCSICITNHRTHQFEHVFNIKQSLLNNRNDIINNLNSNNSSISNPLIIINNIVDQQQKQQKQRQQNSQNESYLFSRINEIWSTAKMRSESYQRLQKTDEEISEHFRQLHDYLTQEEQRIKIPILDDKDSLRDKVQFDINELKSLVNIINISNSNSNDSTDKTTKQNQEDEEKQLFDRTDIQSIIESIQRSKSIQQFINENNQNLFGNFNFSNNNRNNDSSNGNSQDDKDDFKILQLIQQHNKLFKSNNILVNNEFGIVPNNPVQTATATLPHSPLLSSSSSSLSSTSSSAFFSALSLSSASINFNGEKTLSKTPQLQQPHQIQQQQQQQINFIIIN
ncbi:hypothetical protein PPL_02572 [Heterostelium album PN500]|uniref:B box-type domain-containing protein n=1 Tax=Heterostelium pallidum (strain ATCC 26659 / Pp 5 / PN500) TaxID=670386 RepID=D3B2G0_HETP5|nr:hypothetical protein PPL_02572 [Heterostelium album PN500]EFA83508.1 hypothetical protein PPL_02572 [Heterostelium album PN500]|eukprot:XP_020435625.1 hypothetical protein PPL_02572 [Heterostelium album PN500]